MISVILLMGGSSTRMKSNVNKVLLPLGDKLVYEHSLEKFLNHGLEVVIVARNEDLDKITAKNVIITNGGETRGDSVYNGLLKCHGDYVIIHDAARPLISNETIESIINSNLNDAILAYYPVKDTIWVNDSSLSPLDRNKLISASTPQCARYDILMDSYNKAKSDNYISTDDISLIKKYHPEVKVNLLKTDGNDFKLTTNDDYLLAKMKVR